MITVGMYLVEGFDGISHNTVDVLDGGTFAYDREFAPTTSMT